MNIATRRTTRDELLTFMLQHAAEEGWSYSKYDVDFYYNLIQNKIMTITVDDQAVGCIICHESLSSINNMPVKSAGFFFVLKQYRGKKMIGPMLWHNGMTANVNDNTLVCFHSVPRAVDFYGRLGFPQTGLANILYGLPINQLNLLTHVGIDVNCKILSDSEKNDIEKYNQSLFPEIGGCGFRNFIDIWLKRPDAIVVASYEQDEINGYGIATICKQIFINGKEELFYRVAPLYANSPTIAVSILNKLLKIAQGANVTRIQLNSLMTSNSYFGQSLKNIGFTEVTRNYIVSNHVNLFDVNHPNLERIYTSIPLEYPHEVVITSQVT